MKEDPEAYYRYAERKMMTIESVKPLEDENRDIISEDKRMVDILNEYFLTVYTEESTTNVPKPKMVYNVSSNQMLEEVNRCKK